MTEHHHDPDLILALAAGTEPASSPAAAGVAECARCSADLAMQHLALRALAEMPRARLGTDERSRLRAELRSALHLDDALDEVAAASPATKPRWRPLWGLATAAAVFLAIVVVPPAFRALSSGDDEPMFEAAAVTTTTAAADGDALLTAPADAERSTTDAGSTMAVPEAADTGVSPDIVAGDDATGGGDDGARSVIVPVIVLEDPSAPAAELRALQESGGALPYSADAPVTTVAADVVAACREVAGELVGNAVAVTEVDGVPAVVMAYPAAEGFRFTVQALDDCRVLGSAGP